MAKQTLDQFISETTNKGIDFDGYYGYQCMDLMHQYVYNCLGLTDKTILAAPRARDVFEKFDTISGKEYFDKIVNTPSAVPQKGDIVFWGSAVGDAGHVAVALGGNTNTFDSYDQNWPTGSLPHKQNHNYGGVLGWLRPKALPSVGEEMVEVARSHWDVFVHNDTAWHQLCAYLEVITDPNATPFDTIKSIIAGIKSAQTAAENRAEGLANELKIANQEVDNRKEQVGRLEQNLLDEKNLRIEQQNSLKTAGNMIEELKQQYEGRIAQLSQQLDDTAKAKGEALKQLAVCQSSNKEDKANITALKRVIIFIKSVWEAKQKNVWSDCKHTSCCNVSSPWCRRVGGFIRAIWSPIKNQAKRKIRPWRKY